MSETGPRVVIVDDEQAIRRFLRASLSANGYEVFEATTGQEALSMVAYQRADVVILDLGLPDLDGIEVTQRLREWTSIPIIILSVREREAEKIAALDAGADDYLTKPFGVGELLARLRVALRRMSQPTSASQRTIGQLTLDFVQRSVSVDQHEVRLTPTEYDLLRVLVIHSGKVLTHQQLLQQVWGPGYEHEVHLLRVNISNLRRKLERDPTRPQYVLTEPGVGYRFRADDIPTNPPKR